MNQEVNIAIYSRERTLLTCDNYMLLHLKNYLKH